MVKIIEGDICYPKSQALIIPAKTTGAMTKGRPYNISKAGLGSIRAV